MALYDKFAGRNVRRIEALSDGVFAIAITLLVLEIKVPPTKGVTTETGLLHALSSMSDKFLIYFLSFMTMGIFWTGQGVQLNYMEQYDRNLNWMTLFFLLVISLFPFPFSLFQQLSSVSILVLSWQSAFIG